jgi:hypothetical protein
MRFRAQLIVSSAAVFATLLAVAFSSSRTQESRRAVAVGGLPTGASSLVQAGEGEGVHAQRSPRVSGPPSPSPSTVSSGTEPRSPSLLPRVPNDALSSSFAAETTDPSWSDVAEAQILGEISRLAALSLVTIDVECRTNLCRVQSVFPTTDARARQRILGVAATLSLEPRPVVAVSNKSGNVVFLAYFERPMKPTQPGP